MPSRQSHRFTTTRDGWGHRVVATDMSWPLRLVDAGFLGLILLLPFVWGGRQALGNFATVLLSSWIASWWAIHQLRQDRPRWKFSGAEPLLLMAILLVAVQTISLPEIVKDRLSPHINQLLPGWGDNPETSVGLGRWGYLSFAPWQTWSDLVTLVAVILVFFIAVQRIETIKDVDRVLRFVAISGCVTAVFGLVQYFAGNGKFFWFYEHPDTSPETSAKAAFTNSNHFADYLAMSLPAQLWWYVTTARSLAKLREARNLNCPAPTGWRAIVQEWSPALMLALTALGVVCSQSRGGLLVAAVGLTILSVLFWMQRLLDSRAVYWLVGLAVCGTAALLTVGQRLEQELSANIESIKAGAIQRLDREGSREKIWMTDFKVVQDFPAVGTGLGTHRYVYESYHDFPADGTEYSHAENGYLQIAMETGITGMAITALLIGLVGYWCFRGWYQATSQEIRAPCAVAISVLAINLTHSCTDFIWYVPGCMVIVVLTSAAACVLYRLSAPHPAAAVSSEFGQSRTAWGLMLLVVIVGGMWGVQVKWPEVAAEPHFHEYKRLANSKDREDGLTSTRFEIAAILKAVQANPRDPILQMRAARAHMRKFLLAHGAEHDLKMEEIRQAALASQYPNRNTLYAWLDIPEVMGENRRYLHRAQAASLRAMRLCPLEPRPYLESAKLAWLSLAPAEMEDRLMKQALASHPFDGQVQMEYAHYLSNLGNTQEAIAFYQKAFRQDARCRKAIVTDLSPHYPSGFFLSTFELDRTTLGELRLAYTGTSDTKGYRKVVLLLAQSELDAAMHTTGELSASHIVTAFGCFAEMGEEGLATTTLQKAIKRHGNSYNLRSNLANWLYDNGRYAEAIPHLEWCNRRRPDNQSVASRMETAITRSEAVEQMATEVESQTDIR